MLEARIYCRHGNTITCTTWALAWATSRWPISAPSCYSSVYEGCENGQFKFTKFSPAKIDYKLEQLKLASVGTGGNTCKYNPGQKKNKHLVCFIASVPGIFGSIWEIFGPFREPVSGHLKLRNCRVSIEMYKLTQVNDYLQNWLSEKLNLTTSCLNTAAEYLLKVK